MNKIRIKIIDFNIQLKSLTHYIITKHSSCTIKILINFFSRVSRLKSLIRITWFTDFNHLTKIICWHPGSNLGFWLTPIKHRANGLFPINKSVVKAKKSSTQKFKFHGIILSMILKTYYGLVVLCIHPIAFKNPFS